ncbi:biopolymer transporter ExbD [Paraburkholderia sediminicola]|uniref:ExbD/TolR family protein n=1 Tax=Paraburkholderia sediminicola TaxID=458836 RepID=UPI0038BB2A48
MAITTRDDADDVLSEINITPLVDVMLVLLVAFIVTAPLLTNSVRVNLPKTVATSAPKPMHVTTVSIDGAERIFLDREPIAADQIEARLHALHTQHDDLTIALQADADLPYRLVARTVASIEHAGIERLSILTTPEH